jgi:hypothetical protein
MIVGAGISHNFSLAGSPDQLVDGVLKIGGISIWGQIAVIVGIVFCLIIGFTARDRN